MSIKSLATLGLAVIACACAPKGKPPEKPSSLTAAGTSDGSKASDEANLATIIPPTANFFQQGLPSFCEYRPRDKEMGCITCKPEDMLLQRCFQKSAQFDPAKACSHDKDKLKCLVAENLTVIKLDLYNSQEKLFLQNMPAIVTAMKGIATNDEEQTEGQKKLFFSALDFLEKHSLQIITQQRANEMAFQLRRQIAQTRGSADTGIDEAMEQQFLSGMQFLQGEMLAGKLDAQDGLKFIRDVCKPLVKSASLNRMLETLSLEGLTGLQAG